MISSVDDYLYVTGDNIDTEHPHGDLDRITINGGVMPLRSGTAQYILRGEDIAFLMEAMNERLNLVGLYAQATEFRRAVSHINTEEIFVPIGNMITQSGSKFIKDATYPASIIGTTIDVESSLNRTAWSDVPSYHSSWRGLPLTKSEILALFEFEKKISMVYNCLQYSTSRVDGAAESVVSLDSEYPIEPIDPWQAADIYFWGEPGSSSAAGHEHMFGGSYWIYANSITASYTGTLHPLQTAGCECKVYADFELEFLTNGVTTTGHYFDEVATTTVASDGSISATISNSKLRSVTTTMCDYFIGGVPPAQTTADLYSRRLRINVNRVWFFVKDVCPRTRWWS